MIWVDSENIDLKTTLNLPFIGQFFLFIVAGLPPFGVTIVLSYLFQLNDEISGNLLLTTLYIWCHILWKLDVKIYIILFPAWILLLIGFLILNFEILSEFFKSFSV